MKKGLMAIGLVGILGTVPLFSLGKGYIGAQYVFQRYYNLGNAGGACFSLAGAFQGLAIGLAFGNAAGFAFAV